MKSKIQTWTRRRVLRGMLAGSAVTVGLPILDCTLNGNGTAFADTGAPLPTRFAAWFWPLGIGEEEWRPKQAGTKYDLPWRFDPLKAYRGRMNLFSGSQVNLDGAANQTHFTGVQGYYTGKVTASGDYFNSTDAIIANTIGARSRFRSLSVACDGDAKASWTAYSGGKVPDEVSPAALYTRVFGPEFADPNAATFVPDPETMARRSVLSGISDERAALEKNVGAADRRKLDYYFTSLRALEQKLDIQLQKPAPLQACTKPSPVQDDGHALGLISDTLARHDLFCDIFAHALACDQTRVVSLDITQGMTGLRREGDSTSHHSYTHEEPLDEKLGYQVKVAWFQQEYFKRLAAYADKLDAVKEGDKSLLDHMVLFAHTCHGSPRLHSLLNYPFMTIGNANGRMKTGMHVATPGDPATRVTLTLQMAMGVQVTSWGTGSNRVTTPIAGVLA
jgi:hypothetical protein